MASSMDSNHVSVLRSYVKALNERNYEEAAGQFAFPLQFGDKTHTTKTEQIAYMQQIFATTDAKLSIDLVLPNTDGPTAGEGPQLAARLILSLTPTKEAADAYGLDLKGQGRTIPIAEHLFVWFTAGEESKIKKVQFVADIRSLKRYLADPSLEVPDLSSSGIFGGATTQGKNAANIGRLASLWIEAVCAKRVVEAAPEHLHEKIAFNGTTYSREQWAQTLAEVMSHVGDASLQIKTLVANHGKQQVAVKIEMEAPLLKAFGGLQPTSKPILFPEYLFFQFDGDKISGVFTIIDFESIGKSLSQSQTALSDRRYGC